MLLISALEQAYINRCSLSLYVRCAVLVALPHHSTAVLPTTKGIVLSSLPESDDGHVTVCPDTIITFTCSDTLVFGMEWSALPLLNEDNSPALASDIEIGDPHFVEGVFTITLVARELRSDFRGNYTSTLDVVVNDRIGNGTTVTCFTPSTMASLIIVKQGCYNVRIV